MSEIKSKTAITKIDPNKILIRGYKLDELIGKLSYSEMLYLIIRGELPDKNTGKMIEAILVSSVDHGVTPPSTLATLTSTSTGAPLNAALACGILSINKWHGGAIQDCMKILAAIKNKGGDLEKATQEYIKEARAKKTKIFGFGHRIHTDDPRTKKLLGLSKEYKIAGDYVKIAETIEKVLYKETGKKLPLNVDGAIAALLCEMNFDPTLANLFFIIARIPGLAAHVLEEKTREKPMRKINPTNYEYDGPTERGL